jgi:hypothetical protein
MRFCEAFAASDATLNLSSLAITPGLSTIHHERAVTKESE